MAISETSKPEEVLRVRDVAVHFGCTNDTVYHLVRSGELRAIHIGSHIRIPQSAVSDFINARAKQ